MPENQNNYVYGVGFKLDQDSLKQAKNDLKLNLDALSKIVKSYGKVLKVDPNADLSKLFEEVRKIKGIVDAVDGSDVSFGNFVDKGTLSRIATLENGLKSVSETSEAVEASITDLKNSVAEVTGILKQAGAIKFPATFDNLFGDIQDQTAHIKQAKDLINAYKSDVTTLKRLFNEVGAAYNGKSTVGHGASPDQISDWIADFDDLKDKLVEAKKLSADVQEISKLTQQVTDVGIKLTSAFSNMSPDERKSFGANDTYINGIKDYIADISGTFDALIHKIETKQQELKNTLKELQAQQNKYVATQGRKGANAVVASSGKSLGIQEDYTAQVKVTPKTNEVEWVNKINDTIRNIEPQLLPIKLTPTFIHSSKNIKKDVDGELAKVEHTVNVDIEVKDNLTDFDRKIQNIDTSIRNAKKQLEKTGNLHIKFDYEEGGNFRDTAYKIIDKFKKIDAHLYITNGKKFLNDLKGIKDSATTKLKDIPATLVVGDQEKLLESIDTLKTDIEKKIGNIGVKLHIQNMPEFVSDVDEVGDHIASKNITSFDATASNNAPAQETRQLSDAAQKATAELEKLKQTLKSLKDERFDSAEFLHLGEIGKNGKKIKGSTENLKKLLDEYKALQQKLADKPSKDDWMNVYPMAHGNMAALQRLITKDQGRLSTIEAELDSYYQKQIAHIQERQAALNKIVQTEEQITQKHQEQVGQAKSHVHAGAQSQTAQETKNNQQLAMSAEAAVKKVRSLNGTLSQQKKVLKDLEANGINAASFTKLGEWDKDSKSFKKNSQEIQDLLKKYKELQKARLAAGGTKAVGEEASLRGKLAAILKTQKKHVTEIIAANQSELASVKAIANTQKQASTSKSGKQQAANIKAAAAEQDKLNKKIKQQQQILDDLTKHGSKSKYFTQLGEWDDKTKKFKKNAAEMQILVQQYEALKKARQDAGIKKPMVGSEELKLRSRIGTLLKEQKKHIAEIVAKNQEELKSAQKTADAYKKADVAKADTDKQPVASAKGVEKTTQAVDELNASLEKAKQALQLLQSGKIDVVKATGLGDMNKRIDASGIKQSLNWIVNRYKILLTKKQEFEKAGATGSDEYVRNEKHIKIYEELLTNIYQDQLKYTQSRIGQLETEIAKRKEILALQTQQGNAEAAQQTKPKEQKQQQAKSPATSATKITGQVPKDASSVVKLDGATLKSIAKDSTLKSIDGKLSNILQALGYKSNKRGNKLPVEAKDVVINSNTSTAIGHQQQKASSQTAVNPLVETMSAGMQERINRANALSKAGIKISRGTLLRDGNDAFDQILQGVSPRDVVQNIIWPKLVNQLKAKGLTDTDQFNDILTQIAQQSSWKSKTSSSWIHFATPDAKFNDKITKKAYASFADVGEISSELINQILSELRSKGYKGQIKIPNDITGFYDTDQIVGHAADDGSFMILVDVLKKLEQQGTLSNVQTGVDANTKVSFGSKGKQGASFTTMLEEIYKAAPGQVFSVDEIKSIIKSAVASTSGDVDQALFKPIVEDVIRKRNDQTQNVSDMGQNEQLAASADKATKEQSELNAELAETAQKDGGTANINDNIAQDAEHATQEQRELNDELERTQKLASSVVTSDPTTDKPLKIVDTYKSDDKVNETQEIYGWVGHGKDADPTFEHTATVTKTNMEAYNKLYKDYIKSLSKQLELEQKISSTNGPTSKFQEDLKAQKEITAQLESQLQKHTDLFTEQSKQAAMAEATKKATQATATSNAKASDTAINKQITALNKAVESAQQKYKDMHSSVNNLSASAASPIRERFVEYEQLLKKLEAAQQEIAKDPQLLNDESYADGLKQLLSQINKAESEFNTLNQSATEFKQNIRSTSDLKSMDKAFDANNISQMHDEMRKFANAAGYGEAKLLGFNDVNRTATFEIKNGKGQIQQLTVAYNAATNSLGRYVSKTTEATSRYQKFVDGITKSFGNVVRYLASFGSVYELFAAIRQGVTYVREIDAALTELKKVTDATEASYDRFLQNMSKTASTVGSTVSELTTMAAEWARLGYSMEESAQLAASTAVLLNVSEFNDATAASEALISTMQAFGYAADESMHVVDILNEVGNNYAISSDGIATALQDSASSLMTAGASLEESVALIAAANKVVQDPNSVGSALRTISLRLRGTSVEILEEMGEETEGVIESTSKLQEKIKALSGVDILSASGDYRNPYEILKDIAAVYDEMEGRDQAALIELIAGKNRANTLAAILTNFEDLDEAYKSAMDAEGSAMRENEAFLDSIEGRIKKFTTALQTMWMNFINDDAVKFIVDVGTFIIQLVDKIGLLESALGAFAGFKIAEKSIKEAFESIDNDTFKFTNMFRSLTKDKEKDKKKDKETDTSDIDSNTDAIKRNTEAMTENIAVSAAEEEQDRKTASAQRDANQAQLEGVKSGQAEARQDIKNIGLDKQEELQNYNTGKSQAYANTQQASQPSASKQSTGSALGSAVAGAAGAAASTATKSAATGLAKIGASALGVLKGGLKGLAISLVASLAIDIIGGIIGFVGGLFTKEKETIEKANEAIDEYRSKQKELQDQKKTVDSLSESYTRLSGGVNHLTNDNIGLTVESYEEYLDVCNQIADMFPELIEGYDAEGNAILSLKGKVDQLTASYDNAAQSSRNQLITSAKDVFEAFRSSYSNDQWFAWGKSGDVQQLRIAEYMLQLMDTGSDDEINEFFDEITRFGKKIDGDRYNNLEIGAVMEAAAMDPAFGVLNNGTFGLADVDTEKFREQRENLQSFINTQRAKMDEEAQKVRDVLVAYLGEYEPYTTQSEDNRAAIDRIVSSLDGDFFDSFDNINELWASVKTNIVDTFSQYEDTYNGLVQSSNQMAKAIASDKAQAFNTANTSFTELIPQDWLDVDGNIVVDEDEGPIVQYLQQFARDAQNQAKNYEVRLQIRAGIELQPTRPVQEIIEEQTEQAQDAIKDAVSDLEALADNATLGDIFGTIGVYFDINQDKKLRADEINDAYDAYLKALNGDKNAITDWTEPQIESMATLHALTKIYCTDINTIVDEMVKAGYAFKSLDGINSFDLASESTNEFVDKFQSNIDAIKEAWESLSSGDMTQSDFLDLAQEFPKLMDGVDFSQDNWMVQAKANLEALNTTTVDDFIAKLRDMKDAMEARSEDTSIIDSMIVFAEKSREMSQIVKEVQADTIIGLTETYAKYKDIMEETNEVLYDGQKVSDGYYESLVEYIDDIDALNACFDENNKQIVTNANALKELIARQRETDAQTVNLAKSQARLRYYELVRQLGDTTRSMDILTAKSDTTVDLLMDQISTVKNSIYQYQLLEDQLLGVTNAFEQFAKAKELDDQNTYGASYVEMTQTMYDALYKTGQVGSAQFWAAVEATVPDDIYKHLTPGTEQIRAIYDYLNDNIAPTLTLDEDSFSIDYTAIEAFIKKAQETGVFSGTDATSFGLSSDFIYGLADGENALETFADRIGMTTTQVYAMLSEMDKYTTDGAGLSMLLQLDNSTSGQIINTTSALERLYAQRKLLLEQDASETVLNDNLEEIYRHESQLAGLQQQATETARRYIFVSNALADTSRKVSEVLPEEIWRGELHLDGTETVYESLQQINDYKLTLQEPTAVELEIASQSIEDELAELERQFSKRELEANVVLNEDGLYEIKDGATTNHPFELERYVNLKNAQLFIDDALASGLSIQERLLTSIDKNVAAIANENTQPGTNNEQNTGEGSSARSNENSVIVGSQGDPQHDPALTPGTEEYQNARALINGTLSPDYPYYSESGGGGAGEYGPSYDPYNPNANVESANITVENSDLQFAGDPNAARDFFNGNSNGARIEYVIEPDVDLNNRPQVPFDLEHFGQWAAKYRYIVNNIDGDYDDDAVESAQEELDALERGDSTATVYSQTYYRSDFKELEDGESDAAIVVTPILPDGRVLSPAELESYAQTLLSGRHVEPNITLGLFEGENFAAEADAFAASLHESQAALYGLNDATQEATSEAEALYGVYTSFEEKLATLEAIEDKTQALNADEASVFGWSLAEGEILTVADAIERLKQEQDALNQTSVYNPEQYKKIELTVKTYSELQEEMSSYNEILTQTQEIVSDDIKVSKEYKESLKELGITEQELNECFDDGNPLLVSNAKLLNKLVKNANKNVATNIKLAKSQAQLEYYELYKEMAKLTSGTGEMTDATYDNIQSLYGQMGAVQKTIAQFSMLEAQLLGATSAYEQLEEAQAIDSANDYGSRAEELVNILGNAFNTGELGTQAAQTAIAGLIPDGVIDKAKTLDEQMQQIYDYFTTGQVSKLFTIEFDDEGNISSVEMTKENVEEFTKSLIGGAESGAVFQGTWDEFTLNPAIKTMDDFAEALGISKEVAFAYLTELEKYDINWLGGDHETLLDQLMGDNFEYQVQKTVQQMAKLQQEKVALMEDGEITDAEQNRINEINRSLEQLNGTMTSHKEAAYEAWQSYENTENALASLDKLKEASDWNETKFYELGLHEFGLEWNEDTTVQEYYDQLLAKKAELGQPTELLLQLASEETMSELDTLKAQLEEGTDIDIEANVHFNATSGEFEYTGSTEGWTEEKLAKLNRYLELSNDLYDINKSLGSGIDAMEGYAQRTADAVESINQKITGNGNNDTTNTVNESSVNETASTDGTGTDGTSQVNTTADTVTVVTNNATVEAGDNQVGSNGQSQDHTNTSAASEPIVVEATITRYKEAESGVELNTPSIESLTGNVSEYEEVDGGASTENVHPNVTGNVVRYEPSTEDVNTDNVNPDVTGNVTGYNPPMQDVDTTDVNPIVVGQVERYEELPNVTLDNLQTNSIRARIIAYDDTGATMPEVAVGGTPNPDTTNQQEAEDARSLEEKYDSVVSAMFETHGDFDAALQRANVSIDDLVAYIHNLPGYSENETSTLTLEGERRGARAAVRGSYGQQGFVQLKAAFERYNGNISQALNELGITYGEALRQFQLGFPLLKLGSDKSWGELLSEYLRGDNPTSTTSTNQTETGEAGTTTVEADTVNVMQSDTFSSSQGQETSASTAGADGEFIRVPWVSDNSESATVQNSGAIVESRDVNGEWQTLMGAVQQANGDLNAALQELGMTYQEMEALYKLWTPFPNQNEMTGLPWEELIVRALEHSTGLDVNWDGLLSRAYAALETGGLYDLDAMPAFDRVFSMDDPGLGGHAFDTTIFRQILEAAGYARDEVDTLIGTILEYDRVIETASDPDPLKLKDYNASAMDFVNTLSQLRQPFEFTQDGFALDVPDLVSTLREKGWTNEAIKEYCQQLSDVEFDNFNLKLEGLDSIDHLLETINAVPDEDQTNYEVDGSGTTTLENINNQWSKVPAEKSTRYTIYQTTVTNTKRAFNPLDPTTWFVNGTAHAQGTAHKGGSWGAPKTETALTGELGPELRVRGNRWELLGENGAEFNKVRKGDIIFNHKQTEELLSNGYITGRGKAYAEGTVGGSAYAFTRESGVLAPIARGDEGANIEASNVTVITDSTGVNTNTFDDHEGGLSGDYGNQGSGSKGGGGGGSGDDAKDEFNELFDWIEIRLEEINEDINLNAARLENAIGSTKKNAIIDNMIGLNQDLYDNLLAGANEYYRYAATLLKDIPAEYRAAAKDGKIAIEEFVGEVDEETLNAIQKYREWVQKGADVTQQAEEVLTEISNLAKQAIDNIAQDYENKSSLREGRIEQLEAHNALNETDLGFESASIYQAMIAENNRNIAILQDQRNAMLAELNKRVESGEIKRGSQDWYDAINEIAAVDTEIVNLKTDTENWQDAINDLHWEKFDSLISRLQSVSEEADNLIDILGNSDMVDEAGNWTDEGITSLGLYAQQMEAAEVEAKKYQDEIDYLNENWQKLGYTEDEYLERLGELKDGQYAAIQAYHDSKDAIVDLNKERIEAIKTIIEEEIEAYEKLIEAKKEELDAEKD